MHAGLVLALAAALLVTSGCTLREASWLVPRASLGVIVQSREGRLDAAGYVMLTSPPERTVRRLRGRSGPDAPLRLASAPIACAVVAACRWEIGARADAISELTTDEALGVDRREE